MGSCLLEKPLFLAISDDKVERFLSFLRLNGRRKSVKVDKLLIRSLSKIGILSNITEISAEVRVLSITAPSVPFFGSFGADQCASSEGFLVTFTPEGKDSEESTFSLDFSSGYSFEDCFIHIPGSSRCRGPLTHKRKPERRLPLGSTIRRLLQLWRKNRDSGVPERGEHILSENDLEGSFRICVMIPGPTPWVVLEAENPTDDGRIGTDRNHLKKEEHGLLFSGETIILSHI